MNRLLMICACLAALAFVSAASARADSFIACPQDTIDAGCILLVDRHITNLPGATCPGNCVPWQAGETCDGACYDLRAGRLELHFAGGIDCTGTIRVEDEYWITGPAPGTPVELVARLRIEGTLVNATGGARLWDDGSNVASVFFTPADHAVSTMLTIPVVRPAGEPFRLHATMGAYGWEPIDLVGTLEFASASPAAVQSCQGLDQPVPALAGTWGRVKALYR